MAIMLKTIFSTNTAKEISALVIKASKNLSCDQRLSPKYRLPQTTLCVPIPSFIEGINEPNKLISKSMLTKDVITRTTNDIMRIFSYRYLLEIVISN